MRHKQPNPRFAAIMVSRRLSGPTAYSLPNHCKVVEMARSNRLATCGRQSAVQLPQPPHSTVKWTFLGGLTARATAMESKPSRQSQNERRFHLRPVSRPAFRQRREWEDQLHRLVHALCHEEARRRVLGLRQSEGQTVMARLTCLTACSRIQLGSLAACPKIKAVQGRWRQKISRARNGRAPTCCCWRGLACCWLSSWVGCFPCRGRKRRGVHRDG